MGVDLLKLLIASAAAAGCTGPLLRPAPSAEATHPERHVASQSVAGVTVTVDAGAWSGFPAQLHEVIPLKLTVRNDSGRPVLLRFEDLALQAPGGERVAALPPLALGGLSGEGVGGSGLVEPDFSAERFYVAPDYAPFYPAFDPWRGPFRNDPLYHPTYFTQWPVELPTASMVAKALPEGVVDAGGRASGFIYFQDVPRGATRVRFRAELLDARTLAPLATVELPFLAR